MSHTTVVYFVPSIHPKGFMDVGCQAVMRSKLFTSTPHRSNLALLVIETGMEIRKVDL